MATRQDAVGAHEESIAEGFVVDGDVIRGGLEPLSPFPHRPVDESESSSAKIRSSSTSMSKRFDLLSPTRRALSMLVLLFGDWIMSMLDFSSSVLVCFDLLLDELRNRCCFLPFFLLM